MITLFSLMIAHIDSTNIPFRGYVYKSGKDFCELFSIFRSNARRNIF